MEYSSQTGRDFALEEIRKLWASALNSTLSDVTLNLKTESPLALTPNGNVYQLTYVINDGSAVPKDHTTAKRTFDQYLSGVHGTFRPRVVANGDQSIDTTPSPSDASFFNTTSAVPVTAKPPDLPKTYVFPYLIYDELRLVYANFTERNDAIQAFQRIWTESIGNDYRVSQPVIRMFIKITQKTIFFTVEIFNLTECFEKTIPTKKGNQKLNEKFGYHSNF